MADCDRQECTRNREELDALHATWRGNPTKTFYFGMVMGLVPCMTVIVILSMILLAGGAR